MNNPPCHNCPTRHELCHSECAGYKEFQDERKMINEARAVSGKLQNYFIESTYKTIRQTANRR